MGAMFSFGQAQQKPAAPSFFGQQSQPQPQQAPSFSLAPQLGASSSLALSQQPQQQQQFGAAQQAPAAPISSTTRFDELPPNVRQGLEQLETKIRAQTSEAEQLKRRPLGHDILEVTRTYGQVSEEYAGIKSAIEADERTMSEIKAQVQVDLEDVNNTITIIEGFKSPQTRGHAAKAVTHFPFEFFSRKVADCAARVEHHRSVLEQIQQRVGSDAPQAANPAAIMPALRAQYSTCMSLARAVAQLDDELRVLKEAYREVYRRATNSVRDPFQRTADKALAT